MSSLTNKQGETSSPNNVGVTADKTLEILEKEKLAKEAVEKNTQNFAEKSLNEQREDLCMRLQANRRLIALKLVGPERHDQFPRSAAMRFISNHNTREILHKAANAALGLQTFRALRWGMSAMKFFRKGFRKI